jgi:hypothetical protein
LKLSDVNVPQWKKYKQKDSLVQKRYTYNILNLYVKGRGIIYAILYSTCERGT